MTTNTMTPVLSFPHEQLDAMQRLATTTSAAGSAVAAAPMKIRLTRRGRVVFGVLGALLFAVLLAAAALMSAPSAQATLATSEQEFTYVIASPGASLWSIAESVDPQADPRDLVAELARLNQLNGVDIQVGDAIAIPLRYSTAE